jgi:putative SOS response-associated peptidase YedK
MCGRYDLSETGRTLRIGRSTLTLATPQPRYNIAPLQTAPIVRRRGEQFTIDEFRWGLVPGWAGDESLASKTINARAETIARRPVFRAAFQRRRCIVPADGYFEWQKTSGGKIPWRFLRHDRQPLLFAGLWEWWRPPDQPLGGGLGTYSIVTTAAHSATAHVHDRMPLILDPEQAAVWLDPEADPAALLALCAAPAVAELHRYRVGTIVNNSRHDVPDCVRPMQADPPDLLAR